MTLTGHSCITRRKSVFSDTLFTTNPTLADLGLKLGLRSERSRTSLRDGMSLTVCTVLEFVLAVRRLYYYYFLSLSLLLVLVCF